MSINRFSDHLSNPLVSIIIVTYNAVDSIRATLLSILDQTYENTELIIIDGGSTDETVNVIQDYISEVSFFSSEKDDGIYDAMNKGISQAKGEWVIFMNSGDSFAANTVLEEVFYNNEIDHHVSVVYGNTVIRGTGSVVKPLMLIDKAYFYFETICHQSVFCRRSAFVTAGNFNTAYKILADRVWLLNAYLRNLGFQYVPVNISIWERVGFSSGHMDLYIKESRNLQLTYFSRFERMRLKWGARLKTLRNRMLNKKPGKI